MKGATAMMEDEKWKSEGDLRTLKEAEMIRADPDRMKKATALMDDEMKAMMKVMGKSMEDEAKQRFPNTYKKEG